MFILLCFSINERLTILQRLSILTSTNEWLECFIFQSSGKQKTIEGNRKSERNKKLALWAKMNNMAASSTSKALMVVIEGENGIGKSR